MAVRDLVAQCMDADPGARPSAREVVAILGQPESILERPLPSRRTPAAQATVRPCPPADRGLQGLMAGLSVELRVKGNQVVGTG